MTTLHEKHHEMIDKQVADMGAHIQPLQDILNNLHIRQEETRTHLRSRDQNLTKRVYDLEGEAKEVRAYLTTRIYALESQATEVRAYQEALGPIWTTANGTKRPVALLSTGHLNNILKGNFAKDPKAIEFIKQELKRRTEDQRWRDCDVDDEQPAAATSFTQRMEAKAKAQVKANLERTRQAKRRAVIAEAERQTKMRHLLHNNPRMTWGQAAQIVKDEREEDEARTVRHDRASAEREERKAIEDLIERLRRANTLALPNSILESLEHILRTRKEIQRLRS